MEHKQKTIASFLAMKNLVHRVVRWARLHLLILLKGDVVEMKAYLLKRILSLIPVLFVVSVMVFMIIHITPGDPAGVILG